MRQIFHIFIQNKTTTFIFSNKTRQDEIVVVLFWIKMWKICLIFFYLIKLTHGTKTDDFRKRCNPLYEIFFWGEKTNEFFLQVISPSYE